MTQAPLAPSVDFRLPAVNPPPTGRRAQQRAETRERLFQCALAEFREAGVNNAQIDRIAKAAGVVRGTFYFHFATKDHVLFELQRRVEHLVLERVEKLLPGASLIEILERTVDAILEATTLAGGGEVLREMMALYSRHPSSYDDAQDDLTAQGEVNLSDALADRIAATQARGETREDISADQISRLFLTSTFGFLSQLEGEERVNLFAAMVDVFAKGVQRTQRTQR